jgi:transposase
MRELLGEMAERLRMLDNRLMQYERRITRIYRQDERCRQLARVGDVGPLVTTALVAAVSNARQFKSGRELKRPARPSSASTLHAAHHQEAGWPLSAYARSSTEYQRPARGGAQRRRAQHLSESAKLRGGPNVAEVGLANKDPRVMWALLARGDFYRKGSAMDRSSAA